MSQGKLRPKLPIATYSRHLPLSDLSTPTELTCECSTVESGESRGKYCCGPWWYITYALLHETALRRREETLARMNISVAIAALLSLISCAAAHTTVWGVLVNGVDQGDGRNIYIRSPPNNNPVKDLTSAAMACNVNNVGTYHTPSSYTRGV